MSADTERSEEVAFGLNAPYSPTLDNRPAALEDSPLSFTRESDSQMSFGERAALEGILAQLHPKLAIEIGTAEGGSLRRMAAYGKEVHSIDLTHASVGAPIEGNVHFHTGPSAQLLPELLRGFADSGRAVDFALVDGDHSFAGVAGDITVLLRSPATAESVILIHDSMNEEVRAGIESIDFDDYEQVVYHELDFIPGYVYREGVVAGSAWGGIALVICASQRSTAYSRSTRQWRYHEPYAAIQRMRSELLQPGHNAQTDSHAQGQESEELNRLRVQLADTQSELDRQLEALRLVYRSRSWSLTAPMRTAAQRIRARRGSSAN